MLKLTRKVTLQNWQVYAYPLPAPLKAINNIHFLCCYQASNSRIGSDFLFWYYFSQSLKQILAKDQYVPLLLSRKTGKKIELYRRWQAVSSNYESLIQTAVTQMPLACSQHYQPESLLRHFAEVVINELLTAAALEMPQIFTKKVQDDFLATILLEKQSAESISNLPSSYRMTLNTGSNGSKNCSEPRRKVPCNWACNCLKPMRRLLTSGVWFSFYPHTKTRRLNWIWMIFGHIKITFMTCYSSNSARRLSSRF